MSALAAGTVIGDGRYRLESVLGRGGMAIVWLATDLQLERSVAIKIISDVLSSDQRFVSRFEREARLAAGLSHPNLVKVFDFSIEAERPFLVMEYITGGTLRDAHGRRLDATALARELLDALAHIHAAGILHRDVKPANVLLDAAGSPRLTDFGIARSDDQTGLTMTGQVLGTVRYIAPEVAAGEPATRQSDLYSLGVMLGEIAGADPPAPLAGLLLRLTARNPADRPESADGALAELDPTRPLPPSGTQADATRVLSATHARPALRVPRKALAAVAAAIAVVLLVVAGGHKKKLDVKVPTTPAADTAPAPAGAPAGRQLDQLEKIIRAARGA